MFHLNVADLLSSYAGDSRELAFNGEVIPGFYPDIVFTKPLSFQLKLVSLDDGIEVIFEILQTEVEYEGDFYMVSISDISRTFREQYDPLAPDDIKFIDKGNIDLKEVLHEEILMAIL
ncbi:hypothetical protein GW819_00075 [Candidatus Gracilibacteria bacterium]|nr:hypothetical protein [Candidatus Gracilibacteria bacterium]PIQ12293.1 MAG: hypothetical protein COW68_00355 [Candidatus Gracilibacteria bacterium CG18_big_fil_WC_8_21_14_2_50_38_16]PIQ42209.1 MAG: hypothetical protein COW06_00480 [Candidatus Gracilibacteria bacterium CG12_big_fil_rev_8_21_14_0_65_38_15]PIZ01618.1 MAG: hypothetical protein COY60_02615 [Candidatus Gracilibacteria bacterium CG_4_10_14_0_8_um_filter_38_28]